MFEVDEHLNGGAGPHRPGPPWALILSQLGSIPTHLRHVCEDCYDVDNVHKKNINF